MPSQKQLKWSQLRVGLTVLFASLVLAVLIFLMSGTLGLFASKMELYCYFEDAGGVRQGAPVRLEGVDIGNVSAIKLVPRLPTSELKAIARSQGRPQVVQAAKKQLLR